MASKRTRSAAARQTESDNASVSGYLGNSKRQKRAYNPTGDQADTEEASLLRVTRNGTVRRPIKPQPAAARPRARQPPPSGQDDDDDESVNINFHTVVSASNEARRSGLRTVNGILAIKTLADTDQTASKEENDNDPHAEERENGRSLRSILRRNPPRQRYDESFRRELCEPVLSSSEPSASHTPPNVAAGSSANTRTVMLSSRTQQQEQVRPIRRGISTPRAEHKDPSSDSSNENDADIAIEVGEDSAFIQAPRPDEDLATVTVIINSPGGIIQTLAHAAWTGSGKWNISFDKARGGIQNDVDKCGTVLGRNLMKHTKDLQTIFDTAADAAINDHTDDDGAEGYEQTIHCLRDHSQQIGNHFVGIDKLIGRICTEELSGSKDLAGRAIKLRRALLRDIAKRLIPMMVLAIQKACLLGPSEDRRGKRRVEFSSYTLQFFLRCVSWTRRLERALTRGLELWPFDPEFRQDENTLDEEQVKSKDAKKTSRRVFEKQLSALHSKAKEAEGEMQRQAQAAAREEIQGQHRHRQLLRERELDAANELEEAEESKMKLERWQAFCQASQALKHAQNPMKEKWDAAGKVRSSNQVLRQAAPHNSVPSAQRNVQFSSHAPASTSVQGYMNRVEGDLSANDADAEYIFHDDPADEPWGLDWASDEEKKLLWAIRYDPNYEVVSMAAKLRRKEYDVYRKASAFKKAYRSEYSRKGRPVPGWAK